VKRAVLAVVAVGALLAGCGGSDDLTTGTLPVIRDDAVPLKMYWLRDGKIWPALREVSHLELETEAEALAAMTELLEGPTGQEQSDLHLTTAIPEGIDVESVEIEHGVARVELHAELSDEALAQAVYTLTQFPTVQSVVIDGKSFTRADFEEQTPAILVESPLAFEEVTSPLRATGTANTFEATFQYDLTDTDGRVVDSNFVTARSGTGTRGTFDVTTDEFTVPFDGIGALIVYELSAEDGQTRLHLVEIPLKMSK
jgi:hypothetical protein